MDAEYFWIECGGCRLTWKMSLLDCEVDHAVACPFCGNQHFSPKALAAVELDEVMNTAEQSTVSKGRRASEDTQFTWY